MATASPILPTVVVEKRGDDSYIPNDDLYLGTSENVILDVFIYDIPAEGLERAGLYITFDSDQLEIGPGTTYSSPPWSEETTTFSYSNTGGYIDFSGVNDLNPASETDSLITIELQALGHGTSLLDFNLHGSGQDDFVVADAESTVLDPVVTLPSINVIIAPVPSSFILTGSGLLILLGFGRKGKNP
jgi:hypothetical protein